MSNHEPRAFGKRGRVHVSPPEQEQQRAPAPLPADTSAFKWIGGAVAAVFLMAVLAGGTGGGSLLGGLLGGLLGAKLASKLSGSSTTAASPRAPTAAATTSAANPSTTMQRGGFGSTGGSSGSFSSGS